MKRFTGILLAAAVLASGCMLSAQDYTASGDGSGAAVKDSGIGKDESCFPGPAMAPLYRNRGYLLMDNMVVWSVEALDPDIYRSWQLGSILRSSGITVWAAGVGMLAATAAVDLTDLVTGAPANYTGLYISSGILLLIGVPLHLIGNNIMDNAIEKQNARRFPGMSFVPEVNFGCQRHGIGLAVNF